MQILIKVKEHEKLHLSVPLAAFPVGGAVIECFHRHRKFWMALVWPSQWPHGRNCKQNLWELAHGCWLTCLYKDRILV